MMKRWLYKWLPIIFGCHCRKDRSFYYKGEQFPICARCTGELVGIITAVFSCFFFRIPMVVDGTIQLKTAYESNNRRRFVTGFLFGYGLAMLFVVTSIKTFALGRLAAKML